MAVRRVVRNIIKVGKTGNKVFLRHMSADFEYRVMTEKDITNVKQLVYASFAKDEPLSKSLNIDRSESAVFVESITVQSARSNISIVAVCKQSGDIVGCRLSTVDTPTHQAKVPISQDNPKHDKLRIMFAFVARLHVGIDVFQHYGVDKYVHLHAVSVHKDLYMQGIGSRMVEEGIEVAKSAGIRLFVAEVTGLYSQRIYEKLAFDVLKEVEYVDFCDETGDVIFKYTDKHTSGKLVAKLYK